jgi:lipoate-protein ligase A
LSLPAEAPGAALAADEALLEAVEPGGSPVVRWYTARAPAVVLGLGLHHRLAEVLDLDRCAQAGIEVIERRAGGGAVLLDQHLLCCAICLPLPDRRVPADLTDSYRWLGELFAARLRQAGLAARRVEVAEARADVQALRARSDPVAAGLLACCYGALSPHEVAIGSAKVIGLAQVRRRHAALFQAGCLLRDQSDLADLLRLPDAATRDAVRQALRQRSRGLPEVSDAAALARLLGGQAEQFLELPR